MDSPDTIKALDRYLSPVDVWSMAFGCMVGWGVFAMPGNTFLPVAGPAGTLIAMLSGMCIMLVWLLAVAVFAAINLAAPNGAPAAWLAFVAAVPVSMIVWLIFNSIWFNPRRGFLIVSLLMWTLLGAVYVTCLAFGSSPWLLFLIGVPGQIIIAFASKLRYKNRTVVPTDDTPDSESEE